jgi:hypothetical protein
MGFEVMSKLPRVHDYSVAYFIHFHVIYVGAGESFRNKIYRYLMR